MTEYRRGRVLLAGDAAHVHLPAGGQGLSTGVQDSVNLGWKLAAEVLGWAPAGLLDTYHDERHPVGARLLMNTRAQGLLFVGPPELDPLRELFTELVGLQTVRRHLAGIVSGLDVCYEERAAGHPLLGRRLPPRELRTASGRTSTMELLHSAQGVLLDLSGDGAADQAAAGWKDRVMTVTAEPVQVLHEDPLAATETLLVRPDGYVAWSRPGDGELEPRCTGGSARPWRTRASGHADDRCAARRVPWRSPGHPRRSECPPVRPAQRAGIAAAPGRRGCLARRRHERGLL